MYYLNAYGHWLVSWNIQKGETVIRCIETSTGIKKEFVTF